MLYYYCVIVLSSGSAPTAAPAQPTAVHAFIAQCTACASVISLGFGRGFVSYRVVVRCVRFVV